MRARRHERALPRMSRRDKLCLWAAVGIMFLGGGILNYMDHLDEIHRAEVAAIHAEQEAAWAAEVQEKYESYLRWEAMMEERRAVPLSDVPPLVDKPADEAEEQVAVGYFRADVPMDYELQAVLREACEENGVPWSVGLGLIETESSFNPDAVNAKSGCYGLCQLNPKYFPAGLSPADNIRTGIAYLGEQIERYNGDMWAALTAYNAGYDWGGRDYADKVMLAAERWREA